MAEIEKRAFLEAVLPTLELGQYYVSIFIGKPSEDSTIDKLIERYHSTMDSLIETIDNPPSGLWNTYFLVASTNQPNRRGPSIAKRRCFFLDIDLKEYKDKAQAWGALQTFFQAFDLPHPCIVDSGNGIHAYWIMDEDLPIAEWRKVALHLKHLCYINAFYVDPTVTADSTRILRVPQTLNIKDINKVKKSACACLMQPMPFQLFKDLIHYVERDSFEELEFSLKQQSTDSATTNILNAGTQHKMYKHGLTLSLQDRGCKYLAIGYVYQHLMSEPQWRSILSIAGFCADKDIAIHHTSKKYNGYSKEATEAKLSRIEAPHSCETFKTAFMSMHEQLREEVQPKLEAGKSYCDTCTFRNDIKTPISLCMTHIAATQEESIITTVDKSTGSAITVVIPIETYPKQYSRGRNGGVYKKARLDILEESQGGDKIPLSELQGKLIYPFDLWVESLQVDPKEGEIVVMCLKQPREPLVRFSIPLSVVTHITNFTNAISRKGVSAANYNLVSEYVRAFVNELQQTTDKTKCPASFGWEDDNFSSFVLGARRYLANGDVEIVLPSSVTEKWSKYYGMPMLAKVKGVTDDDKINNMLATWRKIFAIHARPNQEARLFAVFLSMASPLFVHFSSGNIYSAILHLTNKESGVGKSTIQHVANSVWCHPNNETLVQLNDTGNSVAQHLGMLKNIIMCMDELTTMRPEEACVFCFGMSTGRGKNRMQANENKNRDNDTVWFTPVITSGNNGMHQLMTQHKLVADGEAARVLEMPVYRDEELQSPQNKAITDRLFGEDLLSCYGVVGHVLLKHYVANAEECRSELMGIRREFDIKAELSQRERFYSAMCSAAIVGARISKRLGVHDVDLDRFEAWTVKFCKAAKDSAMLHQISLIDQMREYLHEVAPNTVVSTIISGKESIKEGRLITQQVHVRHTLDTNRLLVGMVNLKHWCVTRAVSMDSMIKELSNSSGGVIIKARLDLTSNVYVKCFQLDYDAICAIPTT